MSKADASTPDRRGPFFAPELVKAAVFDIGGVFLYPNYSDVQALLVELGVARTTFANHDDPISYRRAHHAGVAALAAASDLQRTDGVPEHTEQFWLTYDRAYAQALGVDDHLIDQVRVAIRTEWAWPHLENIEAFHRLARAGLPVAIVSNNDGSAVQQMADHGVCQVGAGPLPTVPVIVDSGVLGVSKPNPRIMAPALDALGVAPEHVVYVGDTVHADVLGATNAGMQAVQLDPFDHHADYGHPRVRDLAELARQLGF
ncbi:MAG: HAD family hydrolase [Actinomycetota bacterium]|nr:HAD family hydrolase [Actinomycetota bacterium]